jgi:hypothetical protein
VVQDCVKNMILHLRKELMERFHRAPLSGSMCICESAYLIYFGNKCNVVL